MLPKGNINHLNYTPKVKTKISNQNSPVFRTQRAESLHFLKVIKKDRTLQFALYWGGKKALTFWQDTEKVSAHV